MDDNSPYQASRTAPPIATSRQDTPGLPRNIARPIKHMWMLGFILAGFALVFSAILTVMMYRQFQHGEASLVMAFFTVGGALLDAVVFSGLAWGVRRRSRAAACILLGYYLVGQVLFLTQGVGYVLFRLVLITVVSIVFIRGTRAVFAWHRHRPT
jgi:hypothetical protein